MRALPCPAFHAPACAPYLLLRVPPPSFELHVYTMGDRDYAGEMAKLLDPSGALFHGRVISSVRAGGAGVRRFRRGLTPAGGELLSTSPLGSPRRTATPCTAPPPPPPTRTRARTHCAGRLHTALRQGPGRGAGAGAHGAHPGRHRGRVAAAPRQPGADRALPLLPCRRRALWVQVRRWVAGWWLRGCMAGWLRGLGGRCRPAWPAPASPAGCVRPPPAPPQP